MIFFMELFVICMLVCSMLYWFLPSTWRKPFLVVCSTAGLFYLQPIFTVILTALIVSVYALAKLIQSSKEKQGRLLAVGVLSLVLFILACKYAFDIMLLIFSNEAFFVQYIIVPLGVSYLSFKLIAFILDVYREVIEDFTFWDLYLLIVFLPTFPAGPIQRYQSFISDKIDTFDKEFFIDGLTRIAIGYGKKVILINFLLSEYFLKTVSPATLDNISFDLPASQILVFLLLALIYSYIDLSCYADLAIGFSKLFGFTIMEDMNIPILRSNLSEYWNNWHISLSSWCRNYVYFPTLGSTRSSNIALYSSFIVMGIWHNVSINWVLWGVWHASGLIIYSKWSKVKKKYLRKNPKIKERIPKSLEYCVGVVLTCVYASMSFAFIFLDGKTSFFQDPIDALHLLLALIV